MQTLLLVGGGHSHALLLRHARHYLGARVNILLVSPERFAPYAGMLPGLIAGHYRFRDCHIDLARLCEDAGASLVCARAESLDLTRRQARLNNGQSLAFDLVSIDCGLQSASPPAEAGENCLSTRPISQFLPGWQQTLERLCQKKDANLAVVGGGHSGAELAMAIGYRLEREPRLKAPVDVHLVHGGGTLLPDQPMAAQLHASRQLHERHIRVHPLFPVARVAEGELHTERGQHLPADEVLWCIPGAAPRWPADSGLACSDRGFVLVNRQLQSVSHPFVFVAGDIASITDQALSRTGSRASQQARVLGSNLARYVAGENLRSIRKGQKHSLRILSCGDQYAIAQRGQWVLAGKWIWRWKDWMDRRSMARFPRP